MIRRLLPLALLVALAGCITPDGAALSEREPVMTSSDPSPKGRGWGDTVIGAFGDPSDALSQATAAGGEVALAAFSPAPLPSRPRPAILSARRHLECVPYARKLSQIALRGDAWTWWGKAKGQYRRGSAPEAGAVMVLSKTQRLRYGHLAYVVAQLNEREILVHQANWLNRGRIHRYTPVRDVSKNNDWSVVQVWYTPGQRYGSGRYPAYGFIYPNEGRDELLQASN